MLMSGYVWCQSATFSTMYSKPLNNLQRYVMSGYVWCQSATFSTMYFITSFISMLSINNLMSTWLIELWNYIRAHHTYIKQGDLTSPSETMREKWRHDRENPNSIIETCFCQNVCFLTLFFCMIAFEVCLC